jgi:predicted secreted hydrolase
MNVEFQDWLRIPLTSKNYLMLINRIADTQVTRVVKAITAAGEPMLRLTLNALSVPIVAF